MLVWCVLSQLHGSVDWLFYAIRSNSLCTYKHKNARKKSEQKWSRCDADYVSYGCQWITDWVSTASKRKGPPHSCYLCSSYCWFPGSTSDQQWLGWRDGEVRLGHRAHNPEVKQAHICTNSNSKMNCFKWDVPLEQDFKMKKKKKTQEKESVWLGDYQRFIWNDTALRTQLLQMVCGTAYITSFILEWSVKMSCINITWKYIGAFVNRSFCPPPSASQSHKGRSDDCIVAGPDLVFIWTQQLGSHTARSRSLQRGSSMDVLSVTSSWKRHTTHTDTVSCFGNGMSGFAPRQNCSCNARRNKSNACIDDT